MTKVTGLQNQPFHVCGHPTVAVIAGYEKLHRVTSDCRPLPSGGGLGICAQCGCAQAIIDLAWHADAKRIYSDYSPYHQSGGEEQKYVYPVFRWGGARSPPIGPALVTP